MGIKLNEDTVYGFILNNDFENQFIGTYIGMNNVGMLVFHDIRFLETSNKELENFGITDDGYKFIKPLYGVKRNDIFLNFEDFTMISEIEEENLLKQYKQDIGDEYATS